MQSDPNEPTHPPRSKRMTVEDEAALPEMLRYETGPTVGRWGRSVAAFQESLPLWGPMEVNPAENWQRAVHKVLVGRENFLIAVAEELRDRAVKIFKRFRQMDNRKSINLGFVVRVRADTFGPRLDWVRFKGRSEPDWMGKKTAYSEPVKLRGKYRFSDRIFKDFPETIADDLRDIEDLAASVRREVEQLGLIRKIVMANCAPTPPE